MHASYIERISFYSLFLHGQTVEQGVLHSGGFYSAWPAMQFLQGESGTRHSQACCKAITTSVLSVCRCYISLASYGAVAGRGRHSGTWSGSPARRTCRWETACLLASVQAGALLPLRLVCILEGQGAACKCLLTCR